MRRAGRAREADRLQLAGGDQVGQGGLGYTQLGAHGLGSGPDSPPDPPPWGRTA